MQKAIVAENVNGKSRVSANKITNVIRVPSTKIYNPIKAEEKIMASKVTKSEKEFLGSFKL